MKPPPAWVSRLAMAWVFLAVTFAWILGRRVDFQPMILLGIAALLLWSTSEKFR
jgi:UDP-N-acetyl-D-mannosaminuronic acid transferase (WecB/TagA/CpsF family)